MKRLALLAALLLATLGALFFGLRDAPPDAPARRTEQAAAPPPTSATSVELSPPVAAKRVEAESPGESPVRDDEPRAELVVRVVLDGRPAAGARVWIERENATEGQLESAAARYGSDIAELTHEVGRELELDAAGRARTLAPRKAVRVAARIGDFAESEVIARGTTECVLRLRASHDLRVRVLDQHGSPCANAPIALISGHSTPYVVWGGWTDSKGRWIVCDVEGRLDERQERRSGYWIAPLLAESTPARIEVASERLPSDEPTLRLGPTGRITIVACDAKGKQADVSGTATLWLAGGPQFGALRGATTQLHRGRATFEHVGVRLALRVRLEARLRAVALVDASGPESAGTEKRIDVVLARRE